MGSDYRRGDLLPPGPLSRLRRLGGQSRLRAPSLWMLSRRVATASEEKVGMGRRLYVGNIPYTTGEAELQQLFSQAGTVESVRVMRDAATGRARGFAFVEMATDEEAQKAASQFNQYQMGGRALTVNEARPKPEGGFGGGGGYGGGGGNRGGGGGGRREPRW